MNWIRRQESTVGRISPWAKRAIKQIILLWNGLVVFLFSFLFMLFYGQWSMKRKCGNIMWTAHDIRIDITAYQNHVHFVWFLFLAKFFCFFHSFSFVSNFCTQSITIDRSIVWLNGLAHIWSLFSIRLDLYQCWWFGIELPVYIYLLPSKQFCRFPSRN